MFNNYLENKKVLYINDRHEEKGNEQESKELVYDDRIMPLLSRYDSAILCKKIDKNLLSYYRELGLAQFKEENIFYFENILKFSSPTESLLNNKRLLDELHERDFDILLPYIESSNTEIISKIIKAKLIRKVSLVEKLNNKSEFKKIVSELSIPAARGYDFFSKEEGKKAIVKLKQLGINNFLLKRERSVSGFGIYPIVTQNDLEIVIKKINKKEKFLLEERIENVKFSVNIQFWVDELSYEMVSYSFQEFEKNKFSFKGNYFDLNKTKELLNNKELKEELNKMRSYLKEKKCFGISGLDIIHDSNGKFYFCEGNIRINASTYPAFLIKKLFGKSFKGYWETYKIVNRKLTFMELFKNRKKYFLNLNRMKGIIPIALNQLSKLGEGELLVVGENRDEVKKMISKI